MPFCHPTVTCQNIKGKSIVFHGRDHRKLTWVLPTLSLSHVYYIITTLTGSSSSSSNSYWLIWLIISLFIYHSSQTVVLAFFGAVISYHISLAGIKNLNTRAVSRIAWVCHYQFVEPTWSWLQQGMTELVSVITRTVRRAKLQSDYHHQYTDSFLQGRCRTNGVQAAMASGSTAVYEFWPYAN